MINKFLNFLESRGRKRIVMDRVNSQPYLERYYVFLKDRKWFPFNIFLHKFLKSDPDDVHDHPWPYATLILKGGYYEWVAKFNALGEKVSEERVWRGPGHFRVSAATSYHRIELCEGLDCWTLFMPGPKVREWGFSVNNQWIHWERYLEIKKLNSVPNSNTLPKTS
jgi:hypothetical protein